MRLRSFLLLVPVAVLAGVAAFFLFAKRPEKPSEEFVIALEQSLAAAEKQHDLNAFKLGLADDVMNIGIDGKVYLKDFILKVVVDPALVGGMLTISNPQVRVIGRDVAILSYDALVEGSSYKGQPYPRETRVSSVWVRRDGRWQLLLHQATLPPKP